MIKKILWLSATAWLCVACKRYENHKEDMIQSILECKLSDSIQFETVGEVNGVLSYFQDSLQLDLLEHCREKMEQTAKDMQQARRIKFDEISMMLGETERQIKALTPIDTYKKDIKEIRTTLEQEASSNPAKTTVLDFLRKAQKTLNKERNFDAANILLLLLGRSQFFTEPYAAANTCYAGIYTYLMNEPMEAVTKYQQHVLHTINGFSHKLEAEEFWTIYMDMLNYTAADILGSRIVDMLNTYEMYSFVLDRESIFESYQALSSEN